MRDPEGKEWIELTLSSSRGCCSGLYFVHRAGDRESMLVLECCSCGNLWRFQGDGSLAPYVGHLNHGPGVEPPKATNYLCQRLDDLNKEDYDPMMLSIPEFSGNLNEFGDTLRIPICDECIAALYDEDWLLFYCLTCNLLFD